MTITFPTRLGRPPKPSRKFMASESLIELPADALPCIGCGKAVKSPDQSRIVRGVPAGTTRVPSKKHPLGFETVPVNLGLVRCDECAASYERARALVEVQHLGPVFGNVAVDAVDGALAALDMIGIRGSSTESLTRTAAATRALVIVLGSIGDASSWGHYLDSGAHPGTCSAKRWSHVPAATRQRAASGYKAMVERMAEQHEAIQPPVDGERGCLYCGIGSIEALPSEARVVWGSRFTISGIALVARGGRMDTIEGYLCPICRRSIGWRGIGLRTIERALIEFLGYEIRDGYTLNIPKLHAWAARRRGSQPNQKPWAHLDTAQVTRSLPELRKQNLARKKGEEWMSGGIAGWID